jgi:hypothetical protein
MITTDWKHLTELVGIVAIVASLIFVGLQMKQSQEIAIGDQYQARADAALEFYLARMQNENSLIMRGEVIAENVAAGSAPDAIKNAFESESPEMLATRYLYYRSNFTMFDNYHFQYQQGFLSEEAWQAFRTRLKGLLSNAISSAFYSEQTDNFRQSFQTVCTEILAELDAETESETQ